MRKALIDKVNMKMRSDGKLPSIEGVVHGDAGGKGKQGTHTRHTNFVTNDLSPNPRHAIAKPRGRGRVT